MTRASVSWLVGWPGGGGGGGGRGVEFSSGMNFMFARTKLLFAQIFFFIRAVLEHYHLFQNIKRQTPHPHLPEFQW